MQAEDGINLRIVEHALLDHLLCATLLTAGGPSSAGWKISLIVPGS